LQAEREILNTGEDVPQAGGGFRSEPVSRIAGKALKIIGNPPVRFFLPRTRNFFTMIPCSTLWIGSSKSILLKAIEDIKLDIRQYKERV
jgi:hypothetical protein